MIRQFITYTCLFGALFFLYDSGIKSYENQKLDSRGERAPLNPIQDVKSSTSKQRSAKNAYGQKQYYDVTTYKGSLSFTSKSKGPITIYRQIPEGVIKNLQQNMTVYIEFLPENPTVKRLPGDDRDPKLGFIVAAVLFATFWYRRRMPSQ